jgi:hypothetical protein
MSAYSTLYITRRAATEAYFRHLGISVTDEQLEEFLDKLLAPSLYNAYVVDDDREENDDAILRVYS